LGTPQSTFWWYYLYIISVLDYSVLSSGRQLQLIITMDPCGLAGTREKTIPTSVTWLKIWSKVEYLVVFLLSPMGWNFK
jgi:hypothetical protein